MEKEMEKRGLIFKEFYPVNPPFGFAGIQIDEETGGLRYLVVEPTLTEEESHILRGIKHRLIERIDIPLEVLRDEEKIEGYLKEEIRRVLRRFRGKIAEESEEKFIYYLKRDFLGYGRIDILMKDPNIEDISCNGVRTPIYVWHRHYESLPTNVSYDSEEELDAIVRRLAYRAGHQISVAHPIMEGTLPEGYRVHLTLDEVSKRGDTFTIRKLRANPYTIIDLINLGTLSPEIAAYLWILVDNLRSIMICGATASGKTSLLNAIGMFIRPEMKVVTIEEVRELRLHENWIPMVTRPSFQPGVEEVTLYDLLRSALRQRPDYIIVGEVRGEEAYTLFQAIAVGHGGLCTIHAESVDAALKRLLTKPMNIPKMMMPLMNALVLIRRVKLGEEVARRVVSIEEITGVSPEGELMLERRYEWNPEDDSFIYHPPTGEEKDVYQQIMEMRHISKEKLRIEQARRERILRWMVEKGMHTYEEVSQIIRDYYLKPDEVYSAARLGAER